jgi:hypothetical protein
MTAQRGLAFLSSEREELMIICDEGRTFDRIDTAIDRPRKA